MEKNKEIRKIELEIKSFFEIMSEHNFGDVLKLSDLIFGKDFLTRNDLGKQYSLSKKSNLTNSIITRVENKVVGYQIIFAPGNWNEKTIGMDLQLKKFSFPLEYTAYAKTAIVHPNYQGRGLGSSMLSRGIDIARRQGAKAIISHAWANSPNNAAMKMLEKFGAKVLHVYKKRWHEDSLNNKWNCSRCGNPCVCDSIEVEIILDNKNP